MERRITYNIFRHSWMRIKFYAILGDRSRHLLTICFGAVNVAPKKLIFFTNVLTTLDEDFFENIPIILNGEMKSLEENTSSTITYKNYRELLPSIRYLLDVFVEHPDISIYYRKWYSGQYQFFKVV